ncbi:MAG: HlyD family efflux transporter periplasmic adaptor subunit [Magnetococcales bacterium]|nr:HlyD family efflux transporter periplasmic adaptor subunit [Magnetococcales bacterium]
MSLSPANNKNVGKAVLWGGVLLLVVMVFVGAMQWDSQEEETTKISWVKVTRQSFTLKIHERGVVRPAKVAPIKSQISSNQATLTWMIDEGQLVNKGLVVARFDTKPFMEDLEKYEMDLIDAEARFAAAQKALLIQKEEETQKIELMEQKLEIAHIKANDLKHGSGELKRKTLLHNLQKAKRSQEIAIGELKDFDMLLSKGHASQREWDKISDQVQNTKESLALTKAELDNFDTYEFPRLIRESDLIIEGAKNELARAKRTSELEILRKKDTVTLRAREVMRMRDKLTKAKYNVAQCDVTAPIDGILFYKELQRPEGKRKIQLGDAIWVHQTFMEIPDTREMVVEFMVREIDVTKLAVGQNADIKLDAFTDRTFQGSLASIDSLALEDEKQSHLRRFRAKVVFSENVSDSVQVGMSAALTIKYRSLKNALSIPIAAVQYRDGKPIVIVKIGESQQQTPVVIGGMNSKWAEVVEGLTIDDQVLVSR